MGMMQDAIEDMGRHYKQKREYTIEQELNMLKEENKKLTKQLSIAVVSDQRELLKAYDRWDEENCYKLRYTNLMQRLDIFLEAFNCC